VESTLWTTLLRLAVIPKDVYCDKRQLTCKLQCRRHCQRVDAAGNRPPPLTESCQHSLMCHPFSFYAAQAFADLTKSIEMDPATTRTHGTPGVRRLPLSAHAVTVARALLQPEALGCQGAATGAPCWGPCVSAASDCARGPRRGVSMSGAQLFTGAEAVTKEPGSTIFFSSSFPPFILSCGRGPGVQRSGLVDSRGGLQRLSAFETQRPCGLNASAYAPGSPVKEGLG